MKKKIINIENLDVFYDKKKVLGGVNLSLESNGIYTILGVNGSGKTTLLKAIMGMIDIHDKSIIIKQKSKISYVPDTSSLYEYLTGYEYLAFVGKLNDMDTSSIKERSTMLLKNLQLYESRNKIINNYSNGMKQKLSLATAMLTSPDILLLDEPMTGTDFISNNVIKDFLLDFSKNNLVVITTHFFDMAYELSDYIVVLKNGSVKKEIERSNFNDQSFNEDIEWILNE